MASLSGKTLLVVGASSDMGMQLLRSCSEAYDCIYAHYRRLTPELQAVRDSLGQKLHLLQADLTDSESIGRIIDEIQSTGVLPDHIVHFAASPCANGHFHKLPAGSFEEAMTIGLGSLIQICQAFLPNMSRKKSGRIVVMLSSVLEGAPPPYCAHYVTVKYAMLGLMRSLASEYASKGITVNGVSPSWTQTKYIANQPELLIEKYVAENPRGQLLKTEDIIPAIEYLLSESAGAVSGQNLVINCGK